MAFDIDIINLDINTTYIKSMYETSGNPSGHDNKQAVFKVPLDLRQQKRNFKFLYVKCKVYILIIDS